MNSTVSGQVPAVVREALEAANAHDTGRFLGCFAADGAVDDWGRVFTGPAQVHRLARETDTWWQESTARACSRWA